MLTHRFLSIKFQTGINLFKETKLSTARIVVWNILITNAPIKTKFVNSVHTKVTQSIFAESKGSPSPVIHLKTRRSQINRLLQWTFQRNILLTFPTFTSTKSNRFLIVNLSTFKLTINQFNFKLIRELTFPSCLISCASRKISTFLLLHWTQRVHPAINFNWLANSIVTFLSTTTIILPHFTFHRTTTSTFWATIFSRHSIFGTNRSMISAQTNKY